MDGSWQDGPGVTSPTSPGLWLFMSHFTDAQWHPGTPGAVRPHPQARAPHSACPGAPVPRPGWQDCRELWAGSAGSGFSFRVLSGEQAFRV